MRHRGSLLSAAILTAVLAAAAVSEWQGRNSPEPPSSTGVADAQGRGGVEDRRPARYSIVVNGPSVIAEEKPDWAFTIPVENDTGQQVRFEKVISSCACSQAALDASQLPPGGSTRLAVTANLRGRSGQQVFAVRLVEDSGAVWEYQAKAEVIERVKILHRRSFTTERRTSVSRTRSPAPH